ncbi:MAG: NAD-dependent malic enzyme [Absicoccus porci]|uniref:NAD-dependent malic enzyme n=1 Tax=Absicoccus porci TaxID=2486576 RepID=A0A3N0HX15_9FIRM|nr:malic enzyme-like NAD(P)-binding protein [Absicoccus porci]MCI6088916.1 NAD-dependent malic enzyme [Absicoccus porci]MDD7330970.1 NAD-dependent malic enzyme [Absicoccus porci]MDY4738046.1 malic enzyme-like NAD(P)-binding protein [Absicoccus porci]RNM29309.1 NAD-dependent malic enzyme [Absicoccus porci]
MDYAKESLKKHAEWKGKIEVVSRAKVRNADDLSIAYTPGVAQPCLEIEKDPSKSYTLTRRWNMAAVITDGSAVLGLGNIGPEAAMPVMEGKCVLFKEFADVDAFPLCVDSNDVDTIVETIKNISKSFGGINLEDISAPRCFEIERRLKEVCDIPIFHDDQHGTAIITLAGLTNALKVVGKKKEEVKVVTSGAGAAAISIVKLLLSAGFKDIIMTDRRGAIYEGRDHLNWIKEEMAQVTNLEKKQGSLADVIQGADVFIGVSAPGLVSQDMVRSMNKDAIIFACANPTPEIFPDDAKAAGAAVISTGRSDFPNQINNVLAFPGVFRGAFDVRASDINEEMKMAAAQALANLIPDDELSAEYIIPKAFDPKVGPAVAKAVAQAARNSGVARI